MDEAEICTIVMMMELRENKARDKTACRGLKVT
jgi:hypothetical protein